MVLADGDLEFADGTVQQTAPGSGESLGPPPSPSLVLADGGLQFSDGTIQTTAAGTLIPQTGQTICYDDSVPGKVIACTEPTGLGQDGDLQMGAPWPSPRFTKNVNGTVTDDLTGLIWLEDADCFDLQDWTGALAAANGLFDGSMNDPLGGDCALADGSVQGDWRLPNLRELQSLVHYGVSVPAVPNTAGTGQWAEGDPFMNVSTTSYYRSSTTDTSTLAAVTSSSFSVSFYKGDVISQQKTFFGRVWPVRGGQ